MAVQSKAFEALVENYMLRPPAFGAENDNAPTAGRATAMVVSGADRAPSMTALRALVDKLPNRHDRAGYIDVGRMIWGAADGAPEGLELFIEWAAKAPDGGDTDYDRRTWASFRDSQIGYRRLKHELEKADPVAFARFHAAEAGPGFLSNPVSPEEMERLGIDVNAERFSSPKTNAGKPSRLDVLLQIVLDLEKAGWEFFRTPEGRKFIGLGHTVLSIDSARDMDKLSGILLTSMKRTIAGTDKTILKDLLAQRAAAGPEDKVACRRATGSNDEIYWHLADGKDTVIEITPGAWQERSLSDLTAKFERRNGQLPMPRPVRDFAPMEFTERFAKHANLPAVIDPCSADDPGIQARAGLIAATTAYVRGQGTLPMMVFAGPMGSGKTRAATLVKGFIDPDQVPSSSTIGTDARDTLIQTRSQIAVVLDNVSSIQGQTSDLFCTILDGTGYAARSLYTNDDRHVMTAHCGLILTSIRDDAVSREDLLDRTVRVEVEPLQGARRPVQELNKAWQADLPYLLAEFLDLMAGGLKELPAVMTSTSLSDLPRLTDMALFAEAAARSAGWQHGLCLRALMASRHRNVDDNLTSNPIAIRLRVLLATKPFTGTMESLQAALMQVAGPDWGSILRSPQMFRSAVNRVLPSLEQWGITRTKDRTARSRDFTLAMTTS